MENLYIGYESIHILEIKNDKIENIRFTPSLEKMRTYGYFIDCFIKNRNNFVNLKSFTMTSIAIDFCDFTDINKLAFLFMDDKIEMIHINGSRNEYLEKNKGNITLQCAYHDIDANILIDINILNLIFYDVNGICRTTKTLTIEQYFSNLPSTLREINYYVDYTNSEYNDHLNTNVDSVNIIMFSNEPKIPFGINLSLTVKVVDYCMNINTIEYNLKEKLTVYHTCSNVNEQLYKKENLQFVKLKFLI